MSVSHIYLPVFKTRSKDSIGLEYVLHRFPYCMARKTCSLGMLKNQNISVLLKNAKTSKGYVEASKQNNNDYQQGVEPSIQNQNQKCDSLHIGLVPI